MSREFGGWRPERELSAAEKELLDFPADPSIVRLGLYLDQTGHKDLIPSQFDSETWNHPAIEQVLLSDLKRALDDDQPALAIGLRKCLVTNFLKPHMGERTKNIKLPPNLNLEDMHRQAWARLRASVADQAAYRAANDDTADLFDDKIKAWHEIIALITALQINQPKDIPDEMLKFLEGDAASGSKDLLYAFYIRRFFPKIYLPKKPTGARAGLAPQESPTEHYPAA